MAYTRCSAKKTATGDDAMGMKDLIGEMQGGKGRNFADCLPAKIRKKIRSDFREVAKAKKAGHPIPSISAIVRLMKSEYNVKMSPGTAVKWLEHAREELNVKNK